MRTQRSGFLNLLLYFCEIKPSVMAQTNLYIGKTTNNAGESEISMRLYISRDIRIRVSSGIWVDHKRWGKKNEINIPIILGEERQKLLEKRGKLKSLIDFL